MKDSRRGLHSLVEDILPAGRLLEFIEHSPAQVLNLFPSTQPSSEILRNMPGLCVPQRSAPLRCRSLAVQAEIVAATQHRPGQPSVLRRHRYHRFPVAAPTFDIPRPAADRVIFLLSALQDRSGAQDQQGGQVAIPGLGDPPQPLLAARTVLPRHHAQPGRELPPAREIMPVADGRHQCAGRRRANAGQLHQTPGVGVLLRALRDVPVVFGDTRVQPFQVGDGIRRDSIAMAGGNSPIFSNGQK
jgi:hypothetical protein